MPELVSKHQPSMYRRYDHGEYNRHYITNKLQEKKTLEFAKIHTSSYKYTQELAEFTPPPP